MSFFELGMGFITGVIIYIAVRSASEWKSFRAQFLTQTVLYGFVVLLIYKYFADPERSMMPLAQMIGMFIALYVYEWQERRGKK